MVASSLPPASANRAAASWQPDTARIALHRRGIGSSGRVSEVLIRKRKLSLCMVKRLHDGLHIPYESLLS